LGFVGERLTPETMQELKQLLGKYVTLEEIK